MTRSLRYSLAPAALVVLACAVIWWPHVRDEFFVLSGDRNETGGWYGFHSGFGAIILPPLLNGLVIVAVFWWHHQCGVTGCYWYAQRTTAAGDRACWHHHPQPRRTVGDIHAAHHEAAGTRP